MKNVQTMEAGEPNSKPQIPSLGEQFVTWAEEYWRLKEKYSPSESLEGETTNYPFIRQVFIETIDRFLEVRMIDSGLIKK